MSTEPRQMRLTGLHHVTAISRDLERTAAFYRDVLGLALVQQDTNPDEPGVRHFWFGDAAGTAGTLVSFLEYPSLSDGSAGPGAPHHFAFAVASLEELRAWVDYLRAHDVECTDVMDRGRFHSLYLHDPDGHVVEIATA